MCEGVAQSIGGSCRQTREKLCGDEEGLFNSFVTSGDNFVVISFAFLDACLKDFYIHL